MRKITLLLCCVALTLGIAKAQPGMDDLTEGTDLPVLSTGNAGPWYYIQAIGSGNSREGVCFTAENDATNNVNRVYARPPHAADSNKDARNRQLWRFEEGADEGTYIAISRRYPDHFLDQWYNKGMSKWMFGLTPDISEVTTEWMFDDSPEGDGFYNMSATGAANREPANGDIYAHMGNDGWGRGVIFEGATWGKGKNSSFRFVEFEEDEDLAFATDVLDFGKIIPENIEGEPGDKYLEQKVVLMGFSTLTEDISDPEVIEGSEYFAAYAESWPDKKQGGSVAVFFTIPENIKQETTLTGKIKATSGSFETYLNITATIIPSSPVTFSPIDGSADVWYYIQSPKRTGLFMQYKSGDLEEGVKNLDVAPAYSRNDESLSWKFLDAGNGTFKLMNKSGRVIAWEPPVYEEVEDPETFEVTSVLKASGYFYATNSAVASFAFVYDANNDRYVIKHLEAVNSDGNPIDAYLTRVWDTRFGTTTNIADAGNVFYIKEPAKANLSVQSLEFSTEENEVWYFVQFKRNKEDKGFKNRAITVDPEDNDRIIQANIEIDNNEDLFMWKLVGDMNSAKIINKDGLAWGGDTIVKYIVDSVSGVEEDFDWKYASHAVAADDAHSFRFDYYAFNDNRATNSWQLLNLSDNRKEIIDEYELGTSWTQTYLNDFGGNEYRFGQYVKNDGGNEMLFIKVDDFLSINEIEIDNATEEEGVVVATIYYNLQGIAVGNNIAALAPGFYIEKNTLSTGNVAVRKVYVSEK
ncbi:hypothetical protein M2138_000473 [Dysgonomonadaceae bacterium PH5-43]|nr:hypothetical protein [Dysgonomonadaceae bacterium PH5-43]